MHRLKVVSFDKVLSEKENDTEKTEKSKNKSKRHHDHDRKIRHKILSTLKEIKTQRLKAHNATNTEEQVIKKDTALRTAKKISLTSISKQFRLCTKGTFLKSLSSIKTISLDDIKKALINNVNVKRRQKRVKQSHKNTAVSKINVQRRIESKDDIKVLYSFERAKSPEDKRNYEIRRSTSDIFGFGSANRARKNPYLYFHTSNNTGLLPTQRRRKKKTQAPPYIIHQVYPLRLPSRSKRSRFQREYIMDHYNVVGFPKCSKISINSSKLHDQGCSLKLHDHHQSTPLHSYSLKIHDTHNATLAASPDCTGDAGKSNVCEIVEEQRKPSDMCIKKIRECPTDPKNFREWVLLKCRICLIKLKLFVLLLLKLLKYLLIALVIIAWSPCILALAVCWLLVYPLKPHYVLEDIKKSEHFVTCCSTQKIISPTKKKCLSTRILEWTVKTSRCFISKIFDLYPSLMNTELGKYKELGLQKQKHKLCKPLKVTQTCSPNQITEIRPKDCNTSSKWQPHPTKRYILFYDSERGWLMKPLRSEPCDENKWPEVVQNFRFNRKAVTFLNAKQEEDEYAHNCACAPPYCPYPPLPTTIDKMTCVSSTSCFPKEKVDQKSSHKMSQQELTPIVTSFSPLDQKASREKTKQLYLGDASIESENQKSASKMSVRKKSKQLLIPADTIYVPMDQKQARKLGVKSDGLRYAPIDQQAARKLSKQEYIPDDRIYAPMDEKAARKLSKQGYIPDDWIYAPIDQKSARKLSKQGYSPDDRIYAPLDEKAARRKTKQSLLPKYMNNDAINEEDVDKKSKRGRQSFPFIPPKKCNPCPKRKLLLEKRAKAKEQARPKKRCPHPPICRTCVRPCRKRPHTRLQSQTNYYKSRRAYKSNATVQYVKGVKPEPSVGARVCESFKSCGRSLRQLVFEAEKQWDVEIDCNSIYIQTLRKRPCLWIYYRCKSIYPTFLACHRACCNFGYVLLLMLTMCVWCPCFCILYIFCHLMCGCNQ
ncbi:hypothetical protein ABMA27_000746 [Loxostege sticticalis]|uniref:Uncharacterized protein n=1 Tax=Loxostege sticticalis TaxID=481309 RepID=A0ABR3I057_LOXSC